MKTKFLPWLFALLFISSCGMPGPFLPTPTLIPQIQPTAFILPTVTPICISSQPAQIDIDRALAFTGGLFDTPDWKRSYTVSENRVSVTWLNDPLGAVVYLEALIFPCGYEEPDLDNYFSDQNWKTIFANYESYQALAECKRNEGLRLYRFDAANAGADYHINYWVQNDTAQRVIVIMMTFPANAQTPLDDFSFRLFPKLTTCP